MKLRELLSLIIGGKLLIIGCVLTIAIAHYLFCQRWLDSISARQDIERDIEQQCIGDGKETLCSQKINMYNSNGQTGLMVQSRLGRYQEVKLLLKYRADAALISNDAERTTALHLACRSVDAVDGDKIVRILLRNGARTQVRDAHGNTPIHDLLTAASAEKKQKMTSLMLDTYKADINAQNNDGDTPLHVAIHKNDLDWVQYMLKKYPTRLKFDLKNNLGHTPVSLAALYGYDQMVDILKKAMQHNAP